MDDKLTLERFRKAQAQDYQTALAEIRAGQKRSHWMWYIFPQIHDLGRSSISQYYAIKSLQEARDYLKDPVLGSHLVEISNVLLELKTDDPVEVFGRPDNMKLRSCMTLFEKADPEISVFSRVLDKFYAGKRDTRTKLSTPISNGGLIFAAPLHFTVPPMAEFATHYTWMPPPTAL